jgi:hypothetical protein
MLIRARREGEARQIVRAAPTLVLSRVHNPALCLWRAHLPIIYVFASFLKLLIYFLFIFVF